jgi:hypothetical protein
VALRHLIAQALPLSPPIKFHHLRYNMGWGLKQGFSGAVLKTFALFGLIKKTRQGKYIYRLYIYTT